MIDRIGHINIRTPAGQYENTLAFYEGLLGLRRSISMATPGPDNVWLFADTGRAIVHVNSVEEGGDVEPDGASTGRLNHVAFDCRDYDEAIARLDAMGLKYARYETKLDGLVLLVTKDPINNIVIELSFGVDKAVQPGFQNAA